MSPPQDGGALLSHVRQDGHLSLHCCVLRAVVRYSFPVSEDKHFYERVLSPSLHTWVFFILSHFDLLESDCRF